MTKLKNIKLSILMVSIVKFGLLQFSFIQTPMALDLCSAVSASTPQDQIECKLETLLQKFESMTLLDAKKTLEDPKYGLSKKNLRKAFQLAQKKNNAIAMAVVANQLKFLEKGIDLLGDINLQEDHSKFKAELATMVAEMMEKSQKPSNWSDESIKLTTNSITNRTSQITRKAEEVAKVVMKSYFPNVKDSKAVLYDKDFVEFFAQISKSQMD